MNGPTISVITPSFNQGEFIRDAIESVLAQNYPSFEHIVVDGGSTDGTLDILRSYPHLRWSSQTDRGQADAINIGLRRASGKIIAWLNSDDWYAPGAFAAAAEPLQSYPVVMGQCQMTDRSGRPTELVRNLQHNWFDILKYWIYDSIPTQPSILFRRSVLEEVRLDDGSYLDPDLDFCMDLDLWLRIARRYPFNVRLDRVLSYYRMYDTNKTGGDWTLIFKEASRIFARHANRGLERRLTFVIELGDDILSVRAALDALTSQVMQDFEVLLVGSPSAVLGRAAVYEFAAQYAALSLRFTSSPLVGWIHVLNHAITIARAPIVCPVKAGAYVPADFGLTVCNAFGTDSIGLLLSDGANAGLTSIMDASSRPSIEIVKYLLSNAPALSIKAIKRVASLDLGGLNEGPDAYAVAEFCLRMLYKGWQLRIGALPPLRASIDQQNDGARLDVLNRYMAAKLVVALEAEYQSEPFAEVRAAHGSCVRFPEHVVVAARRLLDDASTEWLSQEFEDTSERA